jgi:RHS repeat-associated protein
LTYDALDRVVEEGPTLQILYGPTGKLGVQNGQTNTRTYLGLPKGAEIIYDGTSIVYQHPDLLGNGILGTSNTQGKVFDRFFAPFGEIYHNSGSETPNFTGQFQDLDANLYDFEFREQSPVQGRWLNPDPSGMASATLSDPQTLNRYAYVRGSAMGMTDPNGLWGAWRSALLGLFEASTGNITPPPGWMATSNWMAGNLYATFPPFTGTATVTTSSTVTLPGQNQGQGNATQQGSSGETTQQTGRPDHLLAITDCILADGVRYISYSLKDAKGNQLTDYSVTEHMAYRSNGQPDTSGLSGPDGTTTSGPDKIGDSGFGDYIGGLGFHDDLQTFTATSISSGQSFNIFVRDIRDNDYGTNGIYISGGAVYVNGDITEPRCN